MNSAAFRFLRAYSSEIITLTCTAVLFAVGAPLWVRLWFSAVSGLIAVYCVILAVVIRKLPCLTLGCWNSATWIGKGHCCEGCRNGATIRHHRTCEPDIRFIENAEIDAALRAIRMPSAPRAQSH